MKSFKFFALLTTLIIVSHVISIINHNNEVILDARRLLNVERIICHFSAQAFRN